MEISRIRLGRRSPAELDRRLREAEAGDLSYDHVGSTLAAGPAPAGRADRRFDRTATGSVAAAAEALRAFAPHRGIRGRVLPPAAPLEVGTSLLVVAPVGPVELAVPNRVVGVVDEADRFGFAYGTVTGHAEAGEECFLAETSAPGLVRLSVRVHARPATLAARLGGPVVSWLQAVATRRYLAAWAQAIEGER
jgi:uncharacterized protein (UPF0548 family)